MHLIQKDDDHHWTATDSSGTTRVVRSPSGWRTMRPHNPTGRRQCSGREPRISHISTLPTLLQACKRNCDTLSVSNVVNRAGNQRRGENGAGSGNTFNDIVIVPIASRFSCAPSAKTAPTAVCTPSPLGSPTLGNVEQKRPGRACQESRHPVVDSGRTTR